MGLGIVLATVCIYSVTPKALTTSQIESKARALGMRYPSEMKADFFYKK